MKTSKTSSLSWQNKLISTALASASLFLGAPQLALATVPNVTATNLIVTAGSATAVVTGTSALTITVPGSASNNTVLQWQNFSDGTTSGGQLAASDTVTFNLPTSTSGVLNNIVGNMATVLNGHINSNGNVFFLNPAGIIVGSNSIINVNNFYASTVTDTSATGYFASNGNLGVFNGVTQITGTTSGIIYVQSGASISTALGNGSINLASAYSGASIIINNITNYTGGSTLNTNNTGTVWGAIGGTGSAVVSGIEVDSASTAGNINIISQGSGASVITGNNTNSVSGLTLNTGYVGSTGVLSGGNLSIVTNAGPIIVNGPIAAAGNISLVVNTPNSTSTVGYGSQLGSSVTSNVAAAGALTITTNANISFANVTPLGNLNSVGAANINAGTAGNVNINGDLGSGTLAGNQITLAGTTQSSRTYSNVTAYGAASLTNQGSVAITLAQVGGGITLQSVSGTASLGSSAALSTINGANSLISGCSGATISTANFNVGGTNASTLFVATTNSGLTAKPSNVSLVNVNVNGPIVASANTGTVGLTGVNEISNVNTAQPITLTTTNGSITLSSVTTTNGNITATALSPLNLPANSITLYNVANNTPNRAATADTFVTGNGNIAFNGYSSIATNVAATSGSNNDTSANGNGNITSSGNQSFGGTVSITACTGSISLTNVSIGGVTPASGVVPTTNAVTLTTKNTTLSGGNITFKALSDANVTINTGITDITNITSTTAIYVSSTGNLTTGSGTMGTIIAPSISLIADSAGGPVGNLVLGGNIKPTNNQNTSTDVVTLQSAGNLSTLNQTVSGTVYGITNNPVTLKLTSVTGNINIDSLSSSALGNLTATATAGNVTFNTTGTYTLNGGTVTAANGTISQINGGLLSNTVGTTTALQTLTLNASTITLNGNNTLPSVVLVGGVNGVTVNSGAATTTNIASGTNLAGSLTVTAAGPISIGAANTDTVKVSGFTVLSTLNTVSGGAISQLSDTGSLIGGVSALTNGSNITLGTTANSATLGQISASANGGTVTVYSGTAANLGTVLASTLNVFANGITNTSGSVNVSGNANLFSGTPAVYGGAQAVPGSIILGNASNQAAITNVNVIYGNNLTLNATNATANGVSNTSVFASSPITTLVLNDTSSGNLTFTSTATGVAVGTVAASATSGTLTYSANSGTTGSGAISTSSGAIIASGSGLGNVTFNLANDTSSTTSYIINLGSFTLNNVISSPTATGQLVVSANSNPALASTLTLGTGINLQGSGSVTFNSGNVQTTGVTLSGGVSDSGSAVTVNSSAQTIITGKTISITNPLSSYGPVQITSNGSVNFTNNGNVILTNLTLNSGASGASYITSTTGNISQVNAMSIATAKAPTLSFTAASTGNNGVNLGVTNTVWTGAITNITASGNSAYVTNNDITLGTISILPSTNASPTSSQLSVSTTSGNITQTSTSGVYVWGATTLTQVGSGATTGISLPNGAGNNFGAINVNATTNSNIVENATTAYSSVSAVNWTAQSLKGDVINTTNSNPIIVTGNTTLISNTGNINIASPLTGNNTLEGSGKLISVSAAGNVTLNDYSNLTTLANASTVGGNLSVTNSKNNGTIADQAGTSGITVTGIASFLETGSVVGYINLTGINNKFGGLLTKAVTSATIFASGNLVLAPGSAVGTESITVTGNITTNGTGGSSYTNLYLTTNLGSVTISNPTSISSSLTITAPLGTVNLAGLSASVDLKGNTPTVTSSTYIPPST